jgi:hypothetical protein
VFPSGEDEDGGAEGVEGGGVGACNCVFHGAVHAFVVVFWVWDVGTSQVRSPLITALAMLSPKRPTVVRARGVAEARSNSEHTTRSIDCLPSLTLLFAFVTKAENRHKRARQLALLCQSCAHVVSPR